VEFSRKILNNNPKKTKKTKNREQKNCGEKKNFSFRFIIFIFITPNKKKRQSKLALSLPQICLISPDKNKKFSAFIFP